MTADGEVVPLGPVDKEGHRVPLDTTSLYGPRGEHYKVKSFVHFPLMDGWFMECAFTHDLINVSSLRLKAPDSWEKLLEDLGETLQQGGRSGHPACVYLAARDLCRGHLDKDGQCKLSDADCCVSWMVSNIRDRIEHLCADDGERDWRRWAPSIRRGARSHCRLQRSMRTAAWSARSRDMSICSALAFGVPAAMRGS